MKESDLTKKTLEATTRVEAAPEMALALLGDGESSAGSGNWPLQDAGPKVLCRF